MIQPLPRLPQCWKSSNTFQALLILIALSLLPMCAMCSAMTLTVESAKSHYLLDEPLILTISLKNTSTQNVELPVILDPGVGFFTLFIREQGGQPKMYDCGVRGDIGLPKHGKIFLPGEAVNTRMWLTTTTLGDTPSILSKPGMYTFFARYNLDKYLPGGPVALRSSDIQVQVNQPMGAEKDAYDLLLAGTKGCPWGFTTGEVAQKIRMERYAGLVQQYATSVYALRAQSEYASSFSGFEIFHPQATREEKINNMTQSMEQFRIYAEMARGTLLEADAMLRYGRACAQLNLIEPSALAFEKAFLSPAATTDERMTALAWTLYFEAGGLQEHLKMTGVHYPLPEGTFPLLETARVLGFSVIWDKERQTAIISNPLYTSSLPVGSNTIRVNGHEHAGALSLISETDQIRVSIRTIGYMIGSDWSKAFLP